MMEWLGMEKGVAIESKMVSKRIERAQKAVEGRNFETRKHLLEYDDVMNKQRETIYGLRRQLMFEPEHREYLLGETGVARDLLGDLTQQYLNPEAAPDKWDVENYAVRDREHLRARPGTRRRCRFQDDELRRDRRSDLGKADSQLRRERKTGRRRSDARLRAHTSCSTSSTRSGKTTCSRSTMSNRASAWSVTGKKIRWSNTRKQSFDMFQDMLDRIDTNTIRSLFNLQVVAEQPPDELQRRRAAPAAHR